MQVYYISYPYETKKPDEVKSFHSFLEAVGYGVIYGALKIVREESVPDMETGTIEKVILQVYPVPSAEKKNIS